MIYTLACIANVARRARASNMQKTEYEEKDKNKEKKKMPKGVLNGIIAPCRKRTKSPYAYDSSKRPNTIREMACVFGGHWMNISTHSPHPISCASITSPNTNNAMHQRCLSRVCIIAPRIWISQWCVLKLEEANAIDGWNWLTAKWPIHNSLVDSMEIMRRWEVVAVCSVDECWQNIRFSILRAPIEQIWTKYVSFVCSNTICNQNSITTTN